MTANRTINAIGLLPFFMPSFNLHYQRSPQYSMIFILIIIVLIYYWAFNQSVFIVKLMRLI
uniref:Uncharacterized protein n=1 Tax=Anguilla anguilla TaxID=7936 RepID=A0A0E9XN32_ANGAN